MENTANEEFEKIQINGTPHAMMQWRALYSKTFNNVFFIIKFEGVVENPVFIKSLEVLTFRSDGIPYCLMNIDKRLLSQINGNSVFLNVANQEEKIMRELYVNVLG